MIKNLILRLWLDRVMLDEDWIRLDMISNSAQVSTWEMIRALIWWMYHMPHTYWDEVIKAYRERQR